MAWTCLTPCLVTFFVLGIASAHVAPPSDVILHCGNLINTVAWRYDNPPAGLRYRVDIGMAFNSQGDVGPLWVYPPDLQADLSFLSDQRQDYFLAVTAVLGEEESEAAPADGITFSYYIDSPATQKCSLDLPPATVLDQQDNSVLISFQHPWFKYWHGMKDTHEKLDKSLPVFNYDITLNKKEFAFSANLRCTEKTCEHTLPVDAGQLEHCVTIRGELESISVHSTQDYCALPVQGNKHVIIAVVVSLLVLAVISTVVLLVCLKKTKSSSDLPPSLRFERTVEEERPDASLPVSNSSAPLMVVGTPTVSPNESEPLGEPEPSVGGDADHAGDTVEEEQRGYMSGEQMQEDEDAATSEEIAYERRQVVVSLSPDEDVEGYRG